MIDLKIALVYFSATNVTHTYAQVIRERLFDQGCTVQLFNVTAYASRQEKLPINDFNSFICHDRSGYTGKDTKKSYICRVWIFIIIILKRGIK